MYVQMVAVQPPSRELASSVSPSTNKPHPVVSTPPLKEGRALSPAWLDDCDA